MILSVKRTGVKRNSENECFTSNETSLGLKFSIHCAIVRISCFFSKKKIVIKILHSFFHTKVINKIKHLQKLHIHVFTNGLSIQSFRFQSLVSNYRFRFKPNLKRSSEAV